jgi:hypothetical protein
MTDLKYPFESYPQSLCFYFSGKVSYFCPASLRPGFSYPYLQNCWDSRVCHQTVPLFTFLRNMDNPKLHICRLYLSIFAILEIKAKEFFKILN